MAPSNGLEEAAELVDMAGLLFKEDPGLTVILKCHPLMPYERIRSYLAAELPPHVQLSDEPIYELMSKSSTGPME